MTKNQIQHQCNKHLCIRYACSEITNSSSGDHGTATIKRSPTQLFFFITPLGTTAVHDKAYKDIHPPHIGHSIIQTKCTPGTHVSGHDDDKQHNRDFYNTTALNSQGMGGTDQPSAASHARSATPPVKKTKRTTSDETVKQQSDPTQCFRRDVRDELT